MMNQTMKIATVSAQKVMDLYYAKRGNKSRAKKENQYVSLRKTFTANKVILPRYQSTIPVNLIHNYITNLTTFQILRRPSVSRPKGESLIREDNRSGYYYRLAEIELWKSIMIELGHPYSGSSAVVSNCIMSPQNDNDVLISGARAFVNGMLKAVPEEGKVECIKWLIDQFDISAADRLAVMDHLLTPSRNLSAFAHNNEEDLRKAAS